MESIMSVPVAHAENPECPELILTWSGQELRLSAHPEVDFTVGVHQSNNLTVPGTYLSRAHATFRWRRNNFELIDHSTNGTFVQFEDDQVTRVHRSSIRLWGNGYLSFGEPLAASCAVGFSHV